MRLAESRACEDLVPAMYSHAVELHDAEFVCVRVCVGRIVTGGQSWQSSGDVAVNGGPEECGVR